MIILYLAILVVIVGVIFVITSVEVVRPGGKSAKSKNTVYSMPDFEDKDLPGFEDMDNRSFERDVQVDTGRTEIQQRKNILDGSSFEVVLYNDENGISMDENRNILTDLSSIKNVVRVGRGIAEVGSDGITVRIEKTLYRFDYYRLEKVVSRENHAILSIVGASGAHIIVSDDGLFPKSLQNSYSSFQGK